MNKSTRSEENYLSKKGLGYFFYNKMKNPQQQKHLVVNNQVYLNNYISRICITFLLLRDLFVCTKIHSVEEE